MLSLVKRKNLVNTFLGIFSKDTLSFSMYWGLMVGIYKLTIWTLRSLGRTDDKKNSIIAGVICSLSALIDRDENRRKTLILYILARSFETSVNFANNNNIVKISKNIYVTAYLIIWGFLIFCVYFDKSLTQPSVANTLPKLGFYKTNDFIFLHNICPQIESSRINGDPLNFDMKLYQKLTSSK